MCGTCSFLIYFPRLPHSTPIRRTCHSTVTCYITDGHLVLLLKAYLNRCYGDVKCLPAEMCFSGAYATLEVLEGKVCLVSTLLGRKLHPLPLPSSCTAVNPQVGAKGDLVFIILPTSVSSNLDIFENLKEWNNTLFKRTSRSGFLLSQRARHVWALSLGFAVLSVELVPVVWKVDIVICTSSSVSWPLLSYILMTIRSQF